MANIKPDSQRCVEQCESVDMPGAYRHIADVRAAQQNKRRVDGQSNNSRYPSVSQAVGVGVRQVPLPPLLYRNRQASVEAQMLAHPSVQPKKPSFRHQFALHLEGIVNACGFELSSTSRTKRVSDISSQVATDWEQWKSQPKTEENTTVFITRCRHHLSDLETIRQDIEIVLGSLSQEETEDTENDLLAKVIEVKKNHIVHNINEATIATGKSIAQFYLCELERMRAALARPALRDIVRAELAETECSLQKVFFLADTFKEQLLKKCVALKEEFDDGHQY